MKNMCHSCIPQLGNRTGRKTEQNKQLLKTYETNTNVLQKAYFKAYWHIIIAVAPQKRPDKTPVSLLSSKDFSLPMALSKHLVFC